MLIDAFSLVVVLSSAVVLHEYAHGWVANRLGDPTAKLAGRLTLNPVKHIDPVGTIFVPGILIVLRLLGMNTFVFGWAKPIPVNFWRLNNPKRDMIWVALAGPLLNIFLAFAFSQLARVVEVAAIDHLAEVAVFINLLLAVFNMLPIPPLDGSRVVMGLLPDRCTAVYSRLERYGILIVAVLVSVGALDTVVFGVVQLLGASLGFDF